MGAFNSLFKKISGMKKKQRIVMIGLDGAGKPDTPVPQPLNLVLYLGKPPQHLNLLQDPWDQQAYQ